MSCDKLDTTYHENQHRQPKETAREISDQLALVMNRGKYVLMYMALSATRFKNKLPCNFSTFEYHKPCEIISCKGFYSTSYERLDAYRHCLKYLLHKLH